MTTPALEKEELPSREQWEEAAVAACTVEEEELSVAVGVDRRFTMLLQSPVRLPIRKEERRMATVEQLSFTLTQPEPSALELVVMPTY